MLLERKACVIINTCKFQGSLVTCEFLLQNAANVNQQDAQGRGPLHHATMLGHTGFVSTSPHLYYYKCNADYVLHSKKQQLAFPLQASVFILETRSESKRYRHWGENTAVHSGGGGQRRHCHPVSVVVLILDYRVDWDVLLPLIPCFFIRSPGCD